MAATGLLAACTATPASGPAQQLSLTEQTHRHRMLVPEHPPIIVATSTDDISLARLAVSRIDADSLASRMQSRWAWEDSLPFLTSTAVGRKFLAAATPRVMARGSPEEACPALSMASGTEIGSTGGKAPSRGDVAARALSQCLKQLAPGDTLCGCRVIAVDDIVTVPREQIAYATGTSARLRVPKLGLDLMLIAQDEPGDGAGNALGNEPAAKTVLRDLHGPVAWIDRTPDHHVTLRLKGSARVFDGRSIPVGFRRGRLAERIYAHDAAGDRLSLLIGFDPDELAQHAGAWLAWPKGG